jgi:hypothetical protein
LKPGCVSRIAAAVAPVDRPDEALGTVLGQRCTTTPIAFIAERSSPIADHPYVAQAIARTAAGDMAKALVEVAAMAGGPGR